MGCVDLRRFLPIPAAHEALVEGFRACRVFSLCEFSEEFPHVEYLHTSDRSVASEE